MKGFITYQTYRTKGDRAYVFLYGRLENNQSFVTINEFKQYFFIETKDLKKAEKLAEFKDEKTDYKTIDNKPVTKIITTLPAEITKLRSKFEDHSITCYEADIKFTNRFLIDNRIQGSMEIDGDYEASQDEVDRVYREPDLKPIEWFPKLKTLSIDIETTPDAKEILCISLYSDDIKKVLITKKDKLKNAINCQDEEDLLHKFLQLLQEQDPDIITGWNVIDFDLNVIFKRLSNYKIHPLLGRDNTNCRLRIESGFFRDSKADIPGRQVLDGMIILRNSHIKLRDYKLNTAAHQILGEEKLIGNEVDKWKVIMDYYNKSPQKLVDYNLKDSELVYKILEKTDTLTLTIKKSLLTGMPLNRTSASISSLDSLYFKEARKRKLVLPSSSFGSIEEKLKGAYVMESKPGIYDYIVLLDFKSLYPTIIKTFNIDPITYRKKKDKYTLQAPNKALFTTEIEGIVPVLFDNIWKERDEYKKKKDKVAIYALKVLMNSFWGALASPAYRMYNQDVGNAITSFAREIIQLTAKKIEEKGYKVIYSDTDSIFLISKAKNLKEAEAIGEKLQKYIDSFYKDYVKKKYNRGSKLHLEYEKTYIKFMMPKLRHGDKAAKKRYAGLIKKNNKEELDIVGLEFVRGDWTDAAKEYQKEVLDRIFHDKDIIDYTKKFIEDIKKGKYDDKLKYIKSIRKNLDEYTKINPPHIKAARKLKEVISNKIEYVITTDGPEPTENIKHPLDYDHYIKKQIQPLAESILDLFGKTFEEVEKGSKQTSLSDF